ncbi:MAG: hypothetical protein EF812_07520 [Methanosarcinales archaeon]|nr:MAG: hypothetical protein EF812_07520 [Methanosarcinales archaeon]
MTAADITNENNIPVTFTAAWNGTKAPFKKLNINDNTNTSARENVSRFQFAPGRSIEVKSYVITEIMVKTLNSATVLFILIINPPMH